MKRYNLVAAVIVRYFKLALYMSLDSIAGLVEALEDTDSDVAAFPPVSTYSSPVRPAK